MPLLGIGAMSHNKTMKQTKKLYGVNLGGWLVVEKWLTESLFRGTDAWDEYGLMRSKGAKVKIETHRRTFITEADFEWLQHNGINAVRIPVGYWLFEAVDGYLPAVKYLDMAMRWAEKRDMKVLIDLHGARGSQNGEMHSGKAGSAEWFDNLAYQEQTITLLRAIAERYGESSALWGIELLNEPATQGRYWELVRFYRRVYRELRVVAPAGIHIVFHDGFHPFLFTGVLWGRSSHPVVMDVHWYAFAMGRYRGIDRYLKYAPLLKKLLLWFLQLWQPVIVGEWSAVLPQDAFDATSKNNHRVLLHKNVAMQQQVYRAAAGQFYWNYKTEGRGMWHFRSLVEDGVIEVEKGDNIS